MRIGVKPGQAGLRVDELRELWRVAAGLGFESVWTFDHLTGGLHYEAVTLLAALAAETGKARVGCLVLIPGLRDVDALAAQLATVDALSGGRLEVGLGAGDAFAARDYTALSRPFPPSHERLAQLESAVARLHHLLSPASPLAARPIQAQVPLILGGRSRAIRDLARRRGLAWNLASAAPGEFARLARGQPDPQAQVFLDSAGPAAEAVAAYREAGATRLVFVLTSPVSPADLARLAPEVGIG